MPGLQPLIWEKNNVDKSRKKLISDLISNHADKSFSDLLGDRYPFSRSFASPREEDHFQVFSQPQAAHDEMEIPKGTPVLDYLRNLSSGEAYDSREIDYVLQLHDTMYSPTAVDKINYQLRKLKSDGGDKIEKLVVGRDMCEHLKANYGRGQSPYSMSNMFYGLRIVTNDNLPSGMIMAMS